MENSYNYWSDDGIQYLIDNYGDLDLKEIRDNLNQSEQDIIRKSSKFDLIEKQFLWTEEEIEYLKNNYAETDINILKLNLNNHSWTSIGIEARLLGLRRKFFLKQEDLMNGLLWERIPN